MLHILCLSGSLPTLKVVNMFGETDLKANSAPYNRTAQSNRFHKRSTSLPSLSPDPRYENSKAIIIVHKIVKGSTVTVN